MSLCWSCQWVSSKNRTVFTDGNMQWNELGLIVGYKIDKYVDSHLLFSPFTEWKFWCIFGKPFLISWTPFQSHRSIQREITVESLLNKSKHVNTTDWNSKEQAHSLYILAFQTWAGGRFRLLLVKRQNSKREEQMHSLLQRPQQPIKLFLFRVPYTHVRVSVEILQQWSRWLPVLLFSNFHSRLIFTIYIPPHSFFEGFRFKLCGSSGDSIASQDEWKRTNREMKKRKTNKIK
jgi:hypothetical protein